MKLLSDILYGVSLEEVTGNTNLAVTSIAFDSRKVQKDSLFVAIRGTAVDGHQYIDQAIDSGAIAIVCEEMPDSPKGGVTYVRVNDARCALGTMTAQYYDNPSRDLKLVGVTGTNGKTSVTTLLYRLFDSLGYKSGLISTVENRIHKKVVKATHTTPNPLELNKLLRDMVDAGVSYAFMEVSSHALDQCRTAGVEFAGGVFTNITRDHLDYHKTFDAYIAAKKRLFDDLGRKAFAVVNRDDRHGLTMVQNCHAAVKTFALKSPADYNSKVLDNSFEGLHMTLDGMEFHSRLVGAFNAYNLTAIYAVARELGQDSRNVLTAMSLLAAAEGRFQYVRSKNQITGVVDYAHTPDALKNVLETISGIVGSGQKVVTVVGCGGDRDKGKRPEMAQIAVQYSDKVILTSDNPRSENPETIIDDMRKGLDSKGISMTLSITSRREAIRTAVSLAGGGDVILVAGKGHEKYQEINGERLPFDDVEELKNAFGENAMI
jgi:UDP-N-acetylmuramoyl-L-alanyl-D-glutamate--2,6-diaminopimelate ligase